MFLHKISTFQTTACVAFCKQIQDVHYFFENIFVLKNQYPYAYQSNNLQIFVFKQIAKNYWFLEYSWIWVFSWIFLWSSSGFYPGTSFVFEFLIYVSNICQWYASNSKIKFALLCWWVFLCTNLNTLQ